MNVTSSPKTYIQSIDAKTHNPRQIWHLLTNTKVRDNLVLPEGHYEDGWLRDIAGDVMVGELIENKVLVEDKDGTKTKPGV